MKKLKFILAAFMALVLSGTFTSCSDNDNDNDLPDNPNGGAIIKGKYHFDIWVALGRHGGMGRDVQTLVRSLDNLNADQPTITFQGTGTEVNQLLSLETIVHGAYYYQVPVSGDRFAKYRITDNHIEVVAQRAFATNTYTTRKYTHAWLDDHTLIIMAANGDATKIVWTKLNADNMSIISEGTLNLNPAQEGQVFTTAGILCYRAADNRLFYFYYCKTNGGRGTRTTPMTVASINPSTMTVETNEQCDIDCEMVGSAYGELLQTTTFLDGQSNLYIACFSKDAAGQEHSHLLRIKNHETDFDPTYDGFTGDGKLISVIYMGNNKVMAYARDDSKGTSIDAFSHYYTVLDIATLTSTPVKFNGTNLPFSSGRFSSRMAFVNGKAYIGIDAENANPVIYIYSLADGSVVKGAEMAPGYYFEQIRVLENI